MSLLSTRNEPQAAQGKISQDRYVELLTAKGNERLARRFTEIKQLNPWLTEGVVFALARGEVPNGEVAKITTVAALKQEQDRMASKKTWFQRNVWDKMGAVYGNLPQFLRDGLEQNPMNEAFAKDPFGTFVNPGLSLARNAMPEEVSNKVRETAGLVYGRIGGATAGVVDFLTPDIVGAGVRGLTRYADATMRLPSELVNNSARMITGQRIKDDYLAYDPYGDERGRAGWFKSTTLGTALGNSELMGSGFLVGEKAQELAGERARRYRGTVAGRAFTLGRGSATALFAPGSYEYNVASGVVDAIVNLGTDPTNYVAPEIAALRKAQKAIPTGEMLDDVGQVASAYFLRSAAPGDTIDDFAPMLMNDLTRTKGGKRLLERMVSAKNPSQVQRLFGYKLTAQDAHTIANLVDSEEKAAAFLGSLFSRQRAADTYLSNFTDIDPLELDMLRSTLPSTPAGTLGEYMDEIPGSRRLWRRDDFVAKTPMGRFMDKWNSAMADGVLLIKGDHSQTSASARNLDDYFKGINAPYFNRSEREAISERLVFLRQGVNDALSGAPRGVTPTTSARVASALDFLEETFAALPDGPLDDASRAQVKAAVDSLERALGAPFRGRKRIPQSARVQIDAFRGDFADEVIDLTQSRSTTLLDKFINATRTGNRQKMYETKQEIYQGLRNTMRSLGYDEATIAKKIDVYDTAETAFRSYWVNEAGKPTGANLLKALHEQGVLAGEDLAEIVDNPDMMDMIANVGPGAIIDLLNNSIILPSVRDMRMTLSPFWSRAIAAESKGVQALVTGAGAATEITDLYVNTVFKRLVLMSVGYIMRNILDGQMRVAMLGKTSGLTGVFSPQAVDYIAYVLSGPADRRVLGIKRAGLGGIAGEIWDDIAEDIRRSGNVDPVDVVATEYAKNMRRASYNSVLDEFSAADQVYKSGGATPVLRQQDPIKHTTGVVDELGRIHEDYILRMRLEGWDTRGIIYNLFNTVTGRKVLMEDLKPLLESGLRFSDSSGKRMAINVGNLDDEENLRKAVEAYLDSEVIDRVGHYLGDGRESLRIAALYNKVPIVDNAGRPLVSTYSPEEMGDLFNLPVDEVDELRPGHLFFATAGGGPVERNYLLTGVQEIKDDVTDEVIGRNFSVVPVELDDAFGGAGEVGSDGLRRVIDTLGNRGQLRDWANYAVRAEDAATDPKLIELSRRATTIFFNVISEGATKKLEKSPFWRQMYYQIVRENIDLLSREEALKVIDTITANATEAGVDPERWVGIRGNRGLGIPGTDVKITKGEPGLIDMLRAHADSPAAAAASGTAEELSMFAARLANHRIGGIFFDAAQAKNYEDALRIAFIFQPAWREVMTKWAKIFIDDPFRANKVRRVYTGARDADPDEDGRGYIYKDPVTSKMMFEFPFSQKVFEAANALLGKMVGGTGAEITTGLEAPIQNLNVSFKLVPGFSPVGQFLVGPMLADKPSTAELANLLVPYGADVDFVRGAIPGWTQKLAEAIAGRDLWSNQLYTTTKLDIAKAKMATGEYDTSTEEGTRKLKADTSAAARIIYGLRAISQLIGPTAGSPTYVVRVNAGENKGMDIYADELQAEFQRMRNENYDNAVERFINTYGRDAMMYMAAKTKYANPGTMPTEPFDQFQEDNKALFESFPEVAPYFAPSSDQFSFRVWNKQLRAGQSRRLSFDEMVNESQRVMGSALYKYYRRQFGPNPTKTQQAFLRSKRQYINKVYPGFPITPQFNPGQYPEFINRLKQALDDPITPKTQLTDDLRAYLDQRDNYLAKLGLPTLKGQKATKLRLSLESFGVSLSEDNPDFARIYDEVLASEVEVD